MKYFVKRLYSGDDLKLSVLELAQKNHVTAGLVICAVGSLSYVRLRMPVRNKRMVYKTWRGHFEIVSLIGTVSQDGSHGHLHLSFSDHTGHVYGGHLEEGCLVRTTVELTLGTIGSMVFKRSVDPKTGFAELKVGRRR